MPDDEQATTADPAAAEAVTDPVAAPSPSVPADLRAERPRNWRQQFANTERFKPSDLVQVGQLVRAGVTSAAAAEVLGITADEMDAILHDEASGEPSELELRRVVREASRDARMAAELDLRKRNPAAWLKRQAEGTGGATAKFRRLLGLRRFEEVHERLAGGQSPAHVARIVHEEWKLLIDIGRPKLIEQLRRYRADVVGIVDPDERDPLDEQAGEELEKRLADKVDVGERLEWLANVQTERVRMLLSREVKSNRLDPRGSRDVLALATTLDHLAEFKLQTGMLRRAPVRFEGDLTLQPGSGAEALKVDADKYARLRRAADHVHRLLTDQRPEVPAIDVADPAREVG